jgi:hypothetical protein
MTQEKEIVGSGGGRRAVFDWGKRRWIERRRLESVGRGKTKHAKGLFRQGRLGEPRDLLNGRPHARDRLIAPLQGVGLGRILRREKIVGNRDDGEQDKDEQRQRNKLCPPAFAPRRSESQPKADQYYGYECPGKIEEKLHTLTRVYLKTASF